MTGLGFVFLGREEKFGKGAAFLQVVCWVGICVFFWGEEKFVT